MMWWGWRAPVIRWNTSRPADWQNLLLQVFNSSMSNPRALSSFKRTGFISCAVTKSRWALVDLSPQAPLAADWRLCGKLIDSRKTLAIITISRGPESSARCRQMCVRADEQCWWSPPDNCRELWSEPEPDPEPRGCGGERSVRQMDSFRAITDFIITHSKKYTFYLTSNVPKYRTECFLIYVRVTF